MYSMKLNLQKNGCIPSSQDIKFRDDMNIQHAKFIFKKSMRNIKIALV